MEQTMGHSCVSTGHSLQMLLKWLMIDTRSKNKLKMLKIKREVELELELELELEEDCVITMTTLSFLRNILVATSGCPLPVMMMHLKVL